jgi:hypothetical protein
MRLPPETVFQISFGLLFVMAAVWLGSVLILILRLEKSHPETYRAMGQPRFSRRYTAGQLKACAALLRFILKREHQSLNDASLSRLCDFLQSLFVAYVGGFVALLVYVFANYSRLTH